MNYYNEIEPAAIAWLMELMRVGAIPDGHIDTRSIADVKAEELAGFSQCHFFAGIGGWAYALELAGYAGIKGLWTGSCPCQPFSVAGKRAGTQDARHLWPELRRLVGECRPAIVLGEQVASKDGRNWLGGVRADLETLGYAVGAADLCAAGAGAPHIRQRLYWGGKRLGYPNHPRPQGHGGYDECTSKLSPWSASATIPCADGKTRRISVEPGVFPLAHGVPGRVGLLRGYGNAIVPQVAATFIQSFLGV